MSEDDKEKNLPAGTSLWGAVALAFGYNHLAKQTDVVGERLFFRLMRDAAIEEVKKQSGQVVVTETEEIVLALGQKPPFVNLYTRDIEAIREAVAKFDNLKAVTDGSGSSR